MIPIKFKKTRIKICTPPLRNFSLSIEKKDDQTLTIRTPHKVISRYKDESLKALDPPTWAIPLAFYSYNCLKSIVNGLSLQL